MVKEKVSKQKSIIQAMSAEIRQRPVRLLSLLLLLLVSVFLTSDTRVNSTNTPWAEHDKSRDMNTGEAVFIENHSKDGCQANGWNTSAEWDIWIRVDQSIPVIAGNDFRRIANKRNVATNSLENGSSSP